MKIGTTLTLKSRSSNENHDMIYSCKLIDETEEYLIVTPPVDEKTRQTKVFINGTELLVSFIKENHAVYQFKSQIIKKTNMPHPALMILKPEKDSLKRIQRRHFVRVKTTLDLVVSSPENGFSPFETVTVDISGGGLMLVVPKGVQLNIGDLLHISLVLPTDAVDGESLDLLGKVVRLSHSADIKRASVTFIDLPFQIEQQLIRYCFLIQRQERRKELGNIER
ncbi:MAG TPA: flagellar brake domain-containing protein [Cerasibacillus sp.]|uniref:flagellar brake protein n=1 Tax=Cerasibacillus sp. TaxID=2498711 RepID=UPI002F4014B1